VAFAGKRVDEDRALEVVPIRCSINATDTRTLDPVRHNFTEIAKLGKTVIQEEDTICQSNPTVRLSTVSLVSSPTRLQLIPRVMAAWLRFLPTVMHYLVAGCGLVAATEEWRAYIH
jgi:hypothetical protein